MPFGWIAAATIGSSLLSANAASDAADTQAGASAHAADVSAQAQREATQSQRDMFDIINAQQEPWRQTGQNALGQLIAGTGPDGSFTSTYPAYKPFTASDLNANLAPNYQFIRDQGLQAVNNSNNVKTGLVSGNTLRALSDYAENTAQGSYQDALNNYQTQWQTGFNASQVNQTNIFNRLASIAGLGQAANQQTATAGTTTAGNIGTALVNSAGQIANATMAGGAAAASGRVGAANALSGGLNNAASWYSLPQILNGGGFAGGGGGGGGVGGELSYG